MPAELLYFLAHFSGKILHILFVQSIILSLLKKHFIENFYKDTMITTKVGIWHRMCSECFTK